MSLRITEEIIARQPPEARAIIRALLAEIAELRARVEELERRGKGKTPQNSSLPPSTQHPHAKPPRKKGKKGKKKRGGQPGHPKHARPLIPSDECNHVPPLKPAECRRSGIRFGSCPTSSRSSRSISGIGWCALAVARRRVPSCRRACRKASRGRG
jgi:hypothetical protein